MPDDIVQLTAAAARGEERAVAAFYRRYFDLLYRQARQISRRDESFCLDVVQDVMLRIIRTLRPVASEAQLAAWLKLVVQSVVYDALRRERRRAQREAARAMRPSDEAAHSRIPSARAENGSPHAGGLDERLSWLRGELVRLDPELVRLIELRFLHGWTLARMAGALGLTTGAIDGRLRRALGRLRQAAEVQQI